MKKQNNWTLKKINKKELDILDRVLMILWRKEVESKMDI